MENFRIGLFDVLPNRSRAHARAQAILFAAVNRTNIDAASAAQNLVNDPDHVTMGAMMMSALVLAPNARAVGDLERTREVVVRSLAWLVSAVVAGVIGDVVLAAPSLLDLGEAADLVGCRLVEANDEGDRLRQGAEACRKVRLLVMRAGFTADIGMVDELERFLRGFPDGAIIRATPESLLQTLMPRLAPVVGIVLSREKASRARAFDDLVRSTKGAPHLRSRAIRLA